MDLLFSPLQSDNLDAFGEILHENWEFKKSLTKGISTSDIDDWYEAGRQAGALGDGHGQF